MVVHKEFPLMRYRQLANKCGTFHITECIIRRNQERSEFDCSALCDGQSLNQQLFQGPDLTNNLTGVLCRFRQERIAFMCDI